MYLVVKKGIPKAPPAPRCAVSPNNIPKKKKVCVLGMDCRHIASASYI